MSDCILPWSAVLRMDAAILLFFVPTHNELCEVKLYLASIF